MIVFSVELAMTPAEGATISELKDGHAIFGRDDGAGVYDIF